MIVYSILLYFYPPIKSEECSTKEFKQGYENNKPVKVSKTSELFTRRMGYALKVIYNYKIRYWNKKIWK
jgi:hypothetical protein